MRLTSNVRPTWASTLGALAALALLAASMGSAAAAASASNPPTCQSLEDKCLKHVHRREASSGEPASDGVDRPHITALECYDSFHKAQQSGIWPEHLPFNFAIQCAN